MKWLALVLVTALLCMAASDIMLKYQQIEMTKMGWRLEKNNLVKP